MPDDNSQAKKLLKDIPHEPGVYMMKDHNGKIRYIDETMAVHRIHTHGVWSPYRKNRGMQLKAVAAVYEKMRGFLGDEYDGLITSMLAKHYHGLARECIQEGRHDEAKEYELRFASCRSVCHDPSPDSLRTMESI